MKKLHAFVIKSYIGPLLLTFCIVTFLLLMQFLWKYIDDLVGKGLEFSVIAELLAYTAASFVPLSLPLAVLLSSLMTFGNMGENNELLALKSAGISLERIMFPLIILTIFISFGAFFFANNTLPVINLKMRSLLYDVRRQRPELQIKEGVFYNGIEGYSIKIDHKEPETNKLKQIKIYDHTERKGNIKVTTADSGFMKITEDETKLLMTLYHGQTYYEIPEKRKPRSQNTYPHRKDFFEEQTVIIELSGFGLNRTDENLFRNSYQMMNITQLEYVTDSLGDQIKDKHHQLSRSLLKTTFYKNERLPETRSVINRKIDSTSREDSIAYFEPYTMFDSLSYKDQIQAIKQAVSFARTSKNYIENSGTTIEDQIERLRKYEVEWHKKFTLSFACFIFFFIGAPLGAIIRKGGLGTPVVVSVLFFLLYYIITLTGEKLVRESLTSTFQGMWLSSIILLLSGIFLTYKATTDSVILNTETYITVIKKYLRLKFSKETDTSDEDTTTHQ